MSGTNGMNVWYVRWHLGSASREDPPDLSPLLDLVHGITPVVEVVPPEAALADVSGALRYFDRDPRQLAELLRLRTYARYGVTCTVGVAGNRMLATMAAAGPDDGVHAVADTPAAVAAFLRPRPVSDLPGVGRATVTTLDRHGLYTVGDVADLPLPTLQRLLGATAGRQVHRHAHGVDPRPVVRHAPAPALTAEHGFPLDTVDQAVVRRALLALTVDLGAELRATGQVTHTLTLVVRYADRSTTTRSTTLRDPADSTAALTRHAYRLHAGLGLQRARVRAVTLRAEGLTPAADTPAQLSLDPLDERARRLEAVADRAAARYARGAVTLATLLPPGDAA